MDLCLLKVEEVRISPGLLLATITMDSGWSIIATELTDFDAATADAEVGA